MIQTLFKSFARFAGICLLPLLVTPVLGYAQDPSAIHRQATGILLDYQNESNASIQASRQDRAINDEGVRKAQSLNDLTLAATATGTLSYSDINQRVGNGTRTNADHSDQDLAASLGLKKTVMDWGRMDSQIHTAQLVRAASEHAIRQQAEAIYLIGLKAYYRTARSIARVSLREQTLGNLRSKVAESKQRIAAGVGNSTNLAVAEAGLALGESNLNQERATYESAISDLINYAPEGFTDYIPAKIVLPKPHTILHEISLQQALDSQRENSPSLAASLQAIIIAEAQLDTLKKADEPSISVSASLSRKQGYGNTHSQNTIGSTILSLNVPLISKGTVSSDIARQMQQIQKVRLEHRANVDVQQLSLKRVWNEFHALDASLSALAKNVEARAELLKRAKQGQQAGQFTTTQVLDEEEKLLEAQLLLIDSEFQQLSKGFEIINLIGWSLRDYL